MKQSYSDKPAVSRLLVLFLLTAELLLGLDACDSAWLILVVLRRGYGVLSRRVLLPRNVKTHDRVAYAPRRSPDEKADRIRVRGGRYRLPHWSPLDSLAIQKFRLKFD